MRQRQVSIAPGKAQCPLMPRPRPAPRWPGPWRPWLPPAKALALSFSLALCLAMVGCGPSDEQRRQAVLWQQQQQLARQRLEKCRRDRGPLAALLAALERHQEQLRQLSAARYQSSPAPQPPDPDLAARFSREDRELDELRYRERMRAWQMAEQRAYGHWLEAQAGQRAQLRRESQTLTAQLRRLNPGLFKLSGGDQIDPRAVQLASRCEPADFGLTAKAKGDQGKDQYDP
jgi:hypothetical protein